MSSPSRAAPLRLTPAFRSKSLRGLAGLSLLCALAFIADIRAVELQPPFAVALIEADGVRCAFDPQTTQPFLVPSNTRSLDVTFAPTSRGAATPLRFRYRLDGYDRGWRDPIGVMRFAVRFNDAAENTISGEEFDAHGESEGWTGNPANSVFHQRVETLDVPPGSSRLQIWLSSAGPQQTMGLYAVSEVKVTLLPDEPNAVGRSVEMIPPAGSLMDTGAGTPAGWARHGTSLGIAQIAPRAGSPPSILMRDDRPDAFGGWLTLNALSPALAGVSKVRISWREAYSIGWGGSARVSYRYLPAGAYRLRIQPLTIEGRPQGEESVMNIEVVPPFYERRGFRIAAGVFSAVTIGIVVRQVTRRRWQRRLDALESERAVERERSRIARDLHDNLGADLTYLALLTDLAHADAADPVKVRHHFDQIFDLARGLTRQVDEMVWAVNPANDSLKGFVPFLSNYVQGYLQAAGVLCRLDLPAVLDGRPISSAQRHNLFLIVKEALHNIVKHAQATEACLHVVAEDDCLTIRVQDNGRGIAGEPSSGDGTGNMQQRIRSIGGTLVRSSEVGGGTAIRLTLPLVRTL